MSEQGEVSTSGGDSEPVAEPDVITDPVDPDDGGGSDAGPSEDDGA